MEKQQTPKQKAWISYHCTRDSHHPWASLQAIGLSPHTLISSFSISPASPNDKREAEAELERGAAAERRGGAEKEEDAGSSLPFCSLPCLATVPIFWEDAQGYPGPSFSLCPPPCLWMLLGRWSQDQASPD